MGWAGGQWCAKRGGKIGKELLRRLIGEPALRQRLADSVSRHELACQRKSEAAKCCTRIIKLIPSGRSECIVLSSGKANVSAPRGSGTGRKRVSRNNAGTDHQPGRGLAECLLDDPVQHIKHPATAACSAGWLQRPYAPRMPNGSPATAFLGINWSTVLTWPRCAQGLLMRMDGLGDRIQADLTGPAPASASVLVIRVGSAEEEDARRGHGTWFQQTILCARACLRNRASGPGNCQAPPIN